MDTKTFLLERNQLEIRMEEKRQHFLIIPFQPPTKGDNEILPLLFSLAKYLLGKNKKPFLQTMFTMVGLRLMGPLLHKAFNLVSKRKLASS